MKPAKRCIVFFSDQQRYDCLGKHGNPAGLTPILDAVAEEGTFCRKAFTPQPICTPARACLQTGLYATQNGCYRLGVPLDHSQRTLAHHFREAGFRTSYIGKWHLSENEIVPEEDRGGYQDWLGSNLLEFTSDAYDLVMYDEQNQPVRLPGYRVDGVVDAAIRYIDSHRQDPFFLFVSLLEPHCQNHSFSYPAPMYSQWTYQGRWMPPDLATLGGTSQRHMPGYMGMVKRIDEAFGRMMDALQSLDMMEDTVVLFTTDHGEHFMTRNSTNKMSPHESSIRIPMVFHGGCFTGGRVVDQLVSLIDVAPTLLEAAGIPVPEGMAGRSILPLLAGQAEDWPEDVLIQVSQTDVGRGLRTDRWKYYVRAPHKDPFDDVRSEEYQEAELYDLDVDPYELQNLIHFEGYQDVKDCLRARLIQKIVSSGEPAPVIHAAPNIPQPQGILPQMFDADVREVDPLQSPGRYCRPFPKV